MYMKSACLFLITFTAFGCTTKQQCPKIPETACGQCAVNMANGVEDSAISASVFAVQTADSFVTFLKRAEVYLQEKIDEWKVTHPELVADGEKQLASIRAKVQEYERRAKDYMIDSWGRHE